LAQRGNGNTPVHLQRKIYNVSQRLQFDRDMCMPMLLAHSVQ